MLNSQQKEYINTIRELNTHKYKNIPLWDINSQLIINIIQNNIPLSIKNILKSFYYIFFIQAIPNLEIKSSDYNKNIIWDFLQVRTDLEKETDENFKKIWINKKNFFLIKKSDTNYFKNAFYIHFNIYKSLKIFHLIVNNFKLNIFQKIYIFIEINYNLKLINYYLKIFKHFTPKKFYSTNHIDKNHIILYNMFKNKWTNVFSIQHWKNLYLDGSKLQSNEAQILNINTDKLYVYGNYYKKLFNYVDKNLNIEIINSIIDKNNFKNRDFKNIIYLFLDWPYNGYEKNNLKVINIIKDFSEKYNFNFFIKKHPLDKINYNIYSNKLINNIKQNNNIYYIAHNSWIYMDFIKKWYLIFRIFTWNNDLNINLDINDILTNKEQLKKLIDIPKNIRLKNNLEVVKTNF